MKKTKPLSLSVFQVGLLRRWCNLGSTWAFLKLLSLNELKMSICFKKNAIFTKKDYKTKFLSKKTCFLVWKNQALKFVCFPGRFTEKMMQFRIDPELFWHLWAQMNWKMSILYQKRAIFYQKHPVLVKKTKILSFSSCFVCLQRWWCKLGLIQSFSETSKHK